MPKADAVGFFNAAFAAVSSNPYPLVKLIIKMYLAQKVTWCPFTRLFQRTRHQPRTLRELLKTRINFADVAPFHFL